MDPHNTGTLVYVVIVSDKDSNILVEAYDNREAAMEVAEDYLRNDRHKGEEIPEWIISTDDLMEWHNWNTTTREFIDVQPTYVYTKQPEWKKAEA